jgi:MFS family permease
MWNGPEVNNGQGGDHNSDINLSIAGTRKPSIDLLIALVNLIAMMTETMLPVMVPTLWYDLNIQGFQWLIAGPAVGAAATVLTAGHLYAVFSFKTVYMLFATILLTATVLHGSFTPNMVYLFFARILLGVGLAGQQLGALIYLEGNGTFKIQVRRDFFVTVSSAIGLVLGPIFGGVWAHRDEQWAWGFYTVSIILVLILISLLFELPDNLLTSANSEAWAFGPSLNWSQRLSRMDMLGMVLSFFGIIALFVTFNLAGTQTPWTNGYLYTPLSIGASLVVLFVLQQILKILTSPATQLFPVSYLRHLKTTMLFLLTFLTAATFYTAMPYTALYQMITRPEPSAFATGFYLFFTTTGPHLFFTVVIALYIGSGILTAHPVLPSYSVWSVISSVFLLGGTVLLFVDTPSMLSGNAGLAGIARMFALACIGFWSPITLSVGRHLVDLWQHPSLLLSNGYPAQRHPHHNRVFILFAQYLGVAVALTVTGSIFMHTATSAQLSLTESVAAPAYPATGDNALFLLQGYSFINGDVPEKLFSASIAALRDAFGWAFVGVLGAATLAVVAAGVLLMAKVVAGGGLAALRGPVPRQWRLEMGGVAPNGDVELTAVPVPPPAGLSGTTL